MTDRHTQSRKTRCAVLGDAHVDQSDAATTAFDAPFQTLITEGAWGTFWADGTISRREQSTPTPALLAATGNFVESQIHIRAAAQTGAAQDDEIQAFRARPKPSFLIIEAP